MKALLTIALLATSSIAFADGFVCRNEEGDLTVRAYNHVQPRAGTRNAAVIILSNPQLQSPNRTIATFSSENLLDNATSVYTADVDLRYSGSNRRGELIGGTKLGFIDTLKLDVAFSYANPIPAGSIVEGALEITKRDGKVVMVSLECERYLKN